MEGLFALASAKTVRTLAKTVRTIDGGNQCPLLFEKNTFVGLLYGAKIVRKSSTLHHRLDRIVDFF